VGVALRLGGTNPSTIALGGTLSSFIGDRMLLDTSNFSLSAGAGTVALRPQTGGTAIDLGSTTDAAAGTLQLSDAELDRITAGMLQIGDLAAGPIVVSAALTQ